MLTRSAYVAACQYLLMAVFVVTLGVIASTMSTLDIARVHPGAVVGPALPSPAVQAEVR